MVAHECPIGLLDTIDKITDYSYALVHLFEEYRQYYKFMRHNVKAGRHVILDNSIFELGEAFDWDRYQYWIKKLQPTEYIIPDVLEDVEETTYQCDKWLTFYTKNLPKRCKTIGVIQGKTYSELVECYQYMVKHVDKIAISFDYSFYLQLTIGENMWEKYMMGRGRLLKMLYEDHIFDRTKPHHLLGCALPQEFNYYDWTRYSIQTLDTSNPVQQALLGQKYNGPKGLQTKRKDKVADSFDRREFTQDELDLVHYNCQQFQKIVER